MFDYNRFNSTVLSLYLISLSNNQKPILSEYDNFRKTYGVAKGGSLYEVIINEYKSTSIDGEADIVGLVKAKGGFFKKTGGGGKKTIFKLFYVNAALVDNAQFIQAAAAVNHTLGDGAFLRKRVSDLIKDHPIYTDTYSGSSADSNSSGDSPDSSSSGGGGDYQSARSVINSLKTLRFFPE